MKRQLTIEETVPQVIMGLKDLQHGIKNGEVNDYQTDLILTSLIYSLEHPENHFSDGSVVF